MNGLASILSDYNNLETLFIRISVFSLVASGVSIGVITLLNIFFNREFSKQFRKANPRGGFLVPADFHMKKNIVFAPRRFASAFTGTSYLLVCIFLVGFQFGIFGVFVLPFCKFVFTRLFT